MRNFPTIVQDYINSEQARSIRRYIMLWYVRMTTRFTSPHKNDVQCPVCGWKGRGFIDHDLGYGVIYRHADCPQCFSSHRHRIVAYYLQSHTYPDQFKSVLHFAPERGLLETLRRLFPHMEYISADVNPKKAMRKEDIQHLTFPNNSFDLIICLSVLEHVPNDKKAMKELYRVLGKNGVLLIISPIDTSRKHTFHDDTLHSPKEKTVTYWQADHVRLYGTDFPLFLKQAGFVVARFDALDEMGDDERKHLGIEDYIYICTKSKNNPAIKKRWFV